VTFPPGRARLATSPALTGSTLLVITIGMIVVAFMAVTVFGLASAENAPLKKEAFRIGSPAETWMARRVSRGGYALTSLALCVRQPEANASIAVCRASRRAEICHSPS